MKKLIVFSLFTICATFAASAYIVELSCMRVQTVDPSFLQEDEWEEFLKELEEIYCDDVSTPVRPPQAPNTTILYE